MTLSRPSRRAPIVAGAALALLGAVGAHAADWSSLRAAEHPRGEGSFVVHDGGAFHINGFDANLKIQNSIERYDLASDTWQTVSETTDSPGFATALTHSGVVVVDGETWLIGGRVGAHPGRVTDRVVVFDLETRAWRDGPALPVPFAGGGAALVGRRIHVFGGLDAEARCDVTTHLVHDLDAPGDGWRNLSGSAPFPDPRNHFGTAVLDGRIYAIGGQIGHDPCAATGGRPIQTAFAHAYDPATNAWQRLADLPWAQSHAEPSTFAHAGRVWSVGGLIQGNRVLSYDPAANAWTARDDLSLPNALLAPGARILQGNRLHLFGGGAPDVSNPRTETWVTDVPGLEHDPSGAGTAADAPAPVDDGPIEGAPIEEEPVEESPLVEAPVADAIEAGDDGKSDDGAAGDDSAPSGDETEPTGDANDSSPGADGPTGDVASNTSDGPDVRDDGADADVVAETGGTDGTDVPNGTSDTDVAATESTSDAAEVVKVSGGGAAAWSMLLLALVGGARTRSRRSVRGTIGSDRP